MRNQLDKNYQDIISVENLLLAWQEFICGKKNKPDVQLFATTLIDNILQLHQDLASKTYKHGGYYCFKISDPKPRDISKASVRDRLLHHAVYRILYPFFDQTFISDSYSCRVNKGTHRAINRLRQMFNKASHNNTRTCWVLKLDIRKFFASIDHEILIKILENYIPDQDIMWLLEEIIESFGSDCFPFEPSPRQGLGLVIGDLAKGSVRSPLNSGNSQRGWAKGLPLGNLTSQLFVNVYMNKFDQFVKHRLKARYYIRYADDFILLSKHKEYLTVIQSCITVFLGKELKLYLHPDKIVLKTFTSGVDFLGWINFSHHRVLRAATKKRMLRRLNKNNLQSYLGLLKHGNTFKIKSMINLIYE